MVVHPLNPPPAGETKRRNLNHRGENGRYPPLAGDTGGGKNKITKVSYPINLTKSAHLVLVQNFCILYPFNQWKIHPVYQQFVLGINSESIIVNTGFLQWKLNDVAGYVIN